MKLFIALVALIGYLHAHNHEALIPPSQPITLSFRPQRTQSLSFQSPIQQILTQIQPRTQPVSVPIPVPNPPLQSIQPPVRVVEAPQLETSSPLINGVPVFCPFRAPIQCDLTFPYRTLDGTCNNLRNTWWGKAEAPYKRQVRPAYADGISEPRVSRDGSELPSPRSLTCGIHVEKYEIEPFVNHIFMQWGQWVNHDITSLAVTREEEKPLGICSKCKRTSKCFPVQITSNFTCNCIQQMSHQCIEFTRSSAAFTDLNCQNPERGQLNLQTSYIDGSSVYHTKKEDHEKLRDRFTGRGRMVVAQGNLLPKDMSKKPSDCLDFTQEKRCFKAGDDRVNQNTALMTFHTLLIREHNRIADTLAIINPTWEDETVFQETRRVIIAQIQHITYNEYLPILLGQESAKFLGILPGSPFQYNPDVDPRVNNEYAASYGRFGHSMIRSQYSRVDNKFNTSGHLPMMLRHSYFKANAIYDVSQGGLESIVRGLIKDPIMKVDRFFTDEISKHLFETNDDLGRPFHFDLISINIQRGRDHGVPGYTVFRDLCRLQPIRSWEEMGLFVAPDAVNLFRQNYKFVEDVDLFSASVAEIKPDGAMIGPTLNCLLGLQFRDLKFGDRFWYETQEAPAAFTPAQLNEIRKTSLAKMLCRNLVDTPQMAPRVMLSMKVQGNEMKNCAELEDINWSFWKV